mmetsp:Transcript_82594/g.130599  ORF Transcript_82594/g.130599 Transcript_82594/m.130599 type:complete len:82 (-) Transcript_82594:776-1021(-)
MLLRFRLQLAPLNMFGIAKGSQLLSQELGQDHLLGEMTEEAALLQLQQRFCWHQAQGQRACVAAKMSACGEELLTLQLYLK